MRETFHMLIKENLWMETLGVIIRRRMYL